MLFSRVRFASVTAYNSAPAADALYVGKHVGQDNPDREIEEIGYIVIESGSSLHQDILDAYILELEDVPDDELCRVWRDTTLPNGVWDATIYKELIHAVRAVNEKLPAPKQVTLTGKPTGGAGDVKEFLGGVRPFGKPKTVDQSARSLPVLGLYDVVVVGGGTAGPPARLPAPRHASPASCRALWDTRRPPSRKPSPGVSRGDPGSTQVGNTSAPGSPEASSSALM